MANPRKFSEKIALHNQKQAEETAAFEAIMREVSATTRQAAMKTQTQQQQQPQNHTPQAQAPQHMHLAQPQLGVYRGGSLPNVNQIAGSNSIDLQGALHNLEDMKQAPGRQSLVDRFHRDRNRQIPSHRRQLPFDKRIDVSPYGSVYLSPPPDSSWRRTHSDSALHTSTLGPGGAAQQQQLPGGTTPPQARRMVGADGSMQQQQIDAATMALYQQQQQQQQQNQNRPKSCEVPGINIYPSPEQDPATGAGVSPHGGVGIPISTATSGSLPDLSNLHFPSPMTTPLEGDAGGDQQQYAAAAALAANMVSINHMGNGQQQQQQQQQQDSPGRRGGSGGAPSPLVLQQLQARGSSLEVGVSGLSLDTTSPSHHHYHPYGTSPPPPGRLSPAGGGGGGRLSPGRLSPAGAAQPHSVSPHRQVVTSQAMQHMGGLGMPSPPGGLQPPPPRISINGNSLEDDTANSMMDMLNASLTDMQQLTGGNMYDLQHQHQHHHHHHHHNHHLNNGGGGMVGVGLNSMDTSSAAEAANLNAHMNHLNNSLNHPTNSSMTVTNLNHHSMTNSVGPGGDVNQCHHNQGSMSGGSVVTRPRHPNTLHVPNRTTATPPTGGGQNQRTSPPGAADSNTMHIHDANGGQQGGGGGLAGYRNSVGDCPPGAGGPPSPNSPMSPTVHTYSPSGSPSCITSAAPPNSSVFADNYYMQQQQLQHQFEQFNMENVTSSAFQLPPSSGGGLQFSQANMTPGLSSSQEFNHHQNYYPAVTSPPHCQPGSPAGSSVASPASPHHPPSPQQVMSPGGQQQPPPSPTQLTAQQQQQQHQGSPVMSPHHQHHHHQQHQQNKIPDIILTGEYADFIFGGCTGVDDNQRQQDLVKEIGSAMAGMTDSDFDSDFFPSDEALKVGLDPLDLDGLQMLTDPTNMVADPSVEDSFRLDRL